MPLKVNVGLSKEIGLPDLGSLGASCSIEVQLDQELLFQDLDGLHDNITHTFAACRQAVETELYREQSGNGQQNGNGNGQRRLPPSRN